MATLEWSQKRGKGSWRDLEGNKRSLEIFEGKPKPVRHLSSYLKNGWDFSEERKDQLIKMRKQKEKPPEEAAEKLFKTIFPNFKEE